jgi:undecaprenyl pyrophosphate phosphatase UppP
VQTNVNNGVVVMVRKFRDKCTTKKLLNATMLLVVCVTICTLVLSVILHDATPLVTLIEKSFEFAMVVAGFYLWKAKNENLHKYNQDKKIGDIF